MSSQDIFEAAPEIIFPVDRLYGRGEQQSKTLKEAFLAAALDNGHPGVAIAGLSGTGKSALVHSIEDLVVKNGGLFAVGQFDEFCAYTPYSAIIAALDSLCTHLDEKGTAKLKEDLQEEVHVLASILPTLKEALGDSYRRSSFRTNWGFQRFKTIVKTFLLFFARPIVLVLDDIHWADDQSLGLIEAVLLDGSIPAFLCVVAYRENEVHKKLQPLHDNQSLIHLRTSELNEEDVVEFVSDALQSKNAQALAHVVFRKTLGNIYFVIQFLQLLNGQNLLTYNIFSCTWVWDLVKIEGETNLADNVADVVAGRIQRLPDETRRALQVASCIGHRFDGHILGVLMNHWQYNPKLTEKEWSLDLICASSSIQKPLQRACRDDLLDKLEVERDDLSVFKFSHNRVRSCTYNLIGTERKKLSYHLWIGRILWRVYCDNGRKRDWMLLVAVDQLNRSMELLEDEAEMVVLAKMNIEASQKVSTTSAFFAAASYLRISQRLLGEDKWRKYYDTTLAACTLSSEMEFCCGNFERCKATIAEVLLFAKCMDDMTDASLTHIKCLHSQMHHAEALRVGFDVLSKLGFSAPRRLSMLHVMVELFKVKRLMRGLSDEDFLSYKRCENKRTIAAITILGALTESAFLMSNVAVTAFCSLRMARISLIHGSSKYFSLALGSLSVILIKMGDPAYGRRIGVLSLQISNIYKAKELDTHLLLLHYGFCHHLFAPFQDCIEPLLHAYRLGMSTSSVHSAHSCLSLYAAMHFLSGVPLEGFVKDSKAFIDEACHYGAALPAMVIFLGRQFATNLIGETGKPHDIKLGAMDGLQLHNVQSRKSKKVNEVTLFYELILAYLLGETSTATEKAKEFRKTRDYPICMSFIFPFYRSLVWIGEIRKGNRMFWGYLRRELKIMRSWVKQGFVNCLHTLLIVEADVASLRKEKSRDDVQKLYEKAINAASRSGFNQNAALACELSGAFFRRQGDMEGSKLHLELAIQKYTEWGAIAKVEQLARLYGLDSSTGADGAFQQSYSILGRERRAESRRDKCQHEDWIKRASVKIPNRTDLEPKRTVRQKKQRASIWGSGRAVALL